MNLMLNDNAKLVYQTYSLEITIQEQIDVTDEGLCTGKFVCLYRDALSELLLRSSTIDNNQKYTIKDNYSVYENEIKKSNLELHIDNNIIKHIVFSRFKSSNNTYYFKGIIDISKVVNI